MIDVYNIYKEVLEAKKKIDKERKELEENEVVKEYIKVLERSKLADRQYQLMYTALKKKEYNECNHILIYSKSEDAKRKGRIYTHCGCIKCGITDSVLSMDKPKLEENIMIDYIKSKRGFLIPGKQLDITCDLPVACSIYDGIIELNPNISEDDAIKLFKLALMDTCIDEEPKIKTKDEDFNK